MAKRRAFRLLAGFCPLILAAACVSRGLQPSTLLAPTPETGALTYWCGDGGPLSVEMLPGGVRIVGAEAGSVELPAVPSGQEKRYGRQPYSLALDGKDLLFLKNGSPPLACTR